MTGYPLSTHTPRAARYPSPHGLAPGDDADALYAFLGRMLGKALYDGMLVNIPFAPFFLAKVLGQSPSFHDLAALDPELHRNLLFLKVERGGTGVWAGDLAGADPTARISGGYTSGRA